MFGAAADIVAILAGAGAIASGVYVNFFRSPVLVYALPAADRGGYGVRLRIDNKGTSAVSASKMSALWPPGLKLAYRKPGAPDPEEPWQPVPDEEPDWSKALPAVAHLAPGETAYFDFFAKDIRRSDSSCCILLHVDERRITQIIKIRLLTARQSAPKSLIE